MSNACTTCREKRNIGGAGNWRGTGENSAFTRLCIDERAGTWAHLRATAVEHCQELALVSWDKSFDRPVVLPDGRMLRTLEDARQYILTLPKIRAGQHGVGSSD